jgi:hypothetical protein
MNKFLIIVLVAAVFSACSDAQTQSRPTGRPSRPTDAAGNLVSGRPPRPTDSAGNPVSGRPPRPTDAAGNPVSGRPPRPTVDAKYRRTKTTTAETTAAVDAKYRRPTVAGKAYNRG